MTKEERKRKIEKALDVDFTGMTRQEVEEYALKAAEQSVLNEAEADHWRELYQREVNRKYGRSRDTADIDYAQLSFFNEAEAEADPAVPEPTAQEIKGKPKKSRKKKGHQKKALPVHVTEYRLSGDEMNCPNCGSELHEMKKIIHEEIIVEPARFHIERTVTHVYSCRNCDNSGLGGTIINAPSPKSFMPGSALSASLAAWIIYRKVRRRNTSVSSVSVSGKVRNGYFQADSFQLGGQICRPIWQAALRETEGIFDQKRYSPCR